MPGIYDDMMAEDIKAMYYSRATQSQHTISVNSHSDCTKPEIYQEIVKYFFT